MKFQYIYQIEDFDNLENSTKYEKITELEIIDTSSYLQIRFKLDEEKEDKLENFFTKLNNIGNRGDKRTSSRRTAQRSIHRPT